MVTASFTQASDGIEKSLQGMVTRGKSVSAYLNRVLLRQYQQAQIARWQSENSSEGSTWKPLNPRYASQKKKRFAAYPGGGNALMVATGHLAAGAQARDSSYYFKQVTDQEFLIGINLSALPYASYPGVLRPYMQFSDDTLKGWYSGILRYLASGEEVAA